MVFLNLINIQYIFHIGSAEIISTQWRMHCYRFGTKFARLDKYKKLRVINLEFTSKLGGGGEIGIDNSIELKSQKCRHNRKHNLIR